MKLYSVVGSPNGRKVEAVINQLGLAVDIEFLDFLAGDLNTPQFLALNPNGRVPTLSDGDFTLWESNAIMQYLADRVPGNDLFPQDARTRADIVRWQCWELAHFNNAFGGVAFQTVLKPLLLDQQPDPHLVDDASESLARFAGVLEGHLNGRDYLVGGGLTLADYSVASMEGFQDGIPFDWSPYPNVRAYFDRIRAVPHWSASAPQRLEDLGRRPSAA